MRSPRLSPRGARSDLPKSPLYASLSFRLALIAAILTLSLLIFENSTSAGLLTSAVGALQTSGGLWFVGGGAAGDGSVEDYESDLASEFRTALTRGGGGAAADAEADAEAGPAGGAGVSEFERATAEHGAARIEAQSIRSFYQSKPGRQRKEILEYQMGYPTNVAKRLLTRQQQQDNSSAAGAAGAGAWDGIPGPTGESQLAARIAKAEMQTLNMHEIFRWFGGSALPPNESCIGLPCPLFGKCSKEKSYAAGQCFHEAYVDKPSPGLEPRGVYPLHSELRNEKDSQWELSVGTVFVMENVYINKQGEVFNATHHFITGGCYYLDDFTFEIGTKVTSFDYLVNLVNWNAFNFYHVVTEIVLQFFTTSKVMRAYPGIPVAFKHDQATGMLRPWLAMVGWPLEKLNVQRLRDEDLFFAKKLVTATKSICGKPGGSLLQSLRNDILELQISPPDNSSTPPDVILRGLLEGPGAALPTGGIIVFGRRPAGGSRFLVQEQEILQSLVATYDQKRVVSFWGNASVEDTRALFGRAVLYVGVHGAGMTNLVFMHSGAFVLELRPDQYKNACYHFLANQCGLNYYAVEGQGDFDSALSVNAEGVIDMVNQILPPGISLGG